MAQRDAEPTGKSGWFKLQRALGFGPLLLYSVYHLWAQWPALHGRDAWLSRAQRSGLGTLLGVLLLTLFGAHALLGVYRIVREREATTPARARRSFQLATGVTIAGFTIYHLTHVWPRPDGTAATLERSYERLWESLGQPWVLTIYVLACGALAGHAAHALATWLEPYFPGRAQWTLRFVAGLSGFLLFTLYLQLIGQYAAGEAMLPSLLSGR
jgi:succinate dehydrogenase hydrophobic anchor subunit